MTCQVHIDDWVTAVLIKFIDECGGAPQWSAFFYQKSINLNSIFYFTFFVRTNLNKAVQKKTFLRQLAHESISIFFRFLRNDYSDLNCHFRTRDFLTSFFRELQKCPHLPEFLWLCLQFLQHFRQLFTAFLLRQCCTKKDFCTPHPTPKKWTSRVHQKKIKQHTLSKAE